MGYFLGVLAAALFGANGSVIKVITDAGITPAQLTFFRTLSVMLIAGAWLLLRNREAFCLSLRQIGVMAVLGICGVAVLQWAYAFTVTLLPVGIALLLEYMAVLAVAIIARVFFKESVKRRIWVAVTLVVVGMGFVADLGSGGLNALGVVFGLFTAAGLTLYFLVGERQVAATSPMTVAFWSMGFAAAFWGVFSAWWTIDPRILATETSIGGVLDWVVAPVWVLIVWCGIVGSFLPFWLSFTALKTLPATSAGIVSSSEVLFAFVVAFFVLGQGLTLTQIIGTCIVLVAIGLAQTARPGKLVDADLGTVGVTTAAVETRHTPR